MYESLFLHWNVLMADVSISRKALHENTFHSFCADAEIFTSLILTLGLDHHKEFMKYDTITPVIITALLTPNG